MSTNKIAGEKLTILADRNIPTVEHFAQAYACVRKFEGRALTSEQLQDVNVLLVRSVTTVNEQLLENAPVIFVGTATSGFEHIDQPYLKQRNIAFAHAPGSNANSVVEYVIAAIADVENYLERLFSGETLGIIGYGVIGRALEARMQALGIPCLAYDPWLTPSEIDHAASLDEILRCTVISVHAELTTKAPWSSQHLLSDDELSAIPNNSLLINASRGAVVDNAALKRRLQCKDAPSVVLDVWEGEPAIDQNLLASVTLGTPHIAGYSTDGKILGTRMLFKALSESLNRPWVDPGPAIVAPPLLQLASVSSPAEVVRTLIGQRYSIRRDDAALRKMIYSGASDTAMGFDLLRRDYPERRELLGSVIAPGQSINAQTKHIAISLGVE